MKNFPLAEKTQIGWMTPDDEEYFQAPLEQSSITLEGGDITSARPGNFTVQGGQNVFDEGRKLHRRNDRKEWLFGP